MKVLTFLLAGVLFAFAQCSSPKNADAAQESSINHQPEPTIKQQIANGAMIVDVRTPQEFEAGNFPGSVNIPLEEVASRINEFKDKPSVILYCRTGNRSGQAKMILENNGIKKVTNGINIRHLEDETN